MTVLSVFFLGRVRHSARIWYRGTVLYWRAHVRRLLHPYRPEFHYMRGPGPKWRAKNTEQSSARQRGRSAD